MMKTHKSGAAYWDGDAPGAIPRGIRIVKIKSEAGDANPVGTRGVVIGSMSDGKKIGYFVEWDGIPLPIFVADFKIVIEGLQ